MGIGTKIKEALHGDKDTQHQETSDTSRTPGSYPSEQVPGTHTHDQNAHASPDTNHGTEPSATRSSDHAYGTETGRNTLSKSGRHDDGLTGTTGARHNKLESDYPRDATTGRGSATDTTSRWNEGYAGGSGSKEGVHGPHSSRVGNAAGPRVESDRDASRTIGNNERNLGYETTTGHNPSDRTSITHGNHEAAMGQEKHAPYWGDSASGQHGTRQEGLENHRAYPQSGNTTSNLTSRPHDNTLRDVKTHEYDAPTNSSGWDKTGDVGAGALGAGAIGASELSNRHQEYDMRNYETSGAGPDRHADDQTQGSTSMLDPYNTNNPGSPPSLLDPYNMHGNAGTTAGRGLTGSHHKHDHHQHDNVGTTGALHSGSQGLARDNYDQGGPTGGHEGLGFHGRDNYGASGVNGVHGLDTQRRQSEAGGIGGFGHDQHPVVGTKLDRHVAGSNSGRAGPMGQDHFGPGHAGAKVVHSCDHCGRDNDISRYFAKEATNRMG